MKSMVNSSFNTHHERSNSLNTNLLHVLNRNDSRHLDPHLSLLMSSNINKIDSSVVKIRDENTLTQSNVFTNVMQQ